MKWLVGMSALLISSIACGQDKPSSDATAATAPTPEPGPAAVPEPAPATPAVGSETSTPAMAEKPENSPWTTRPFIGGGVGMGVLRGAMLELDGRWLDDYLSVGLGYAFIPEIGRDVEDFKLKVSSKTLYGEARVHPFAGAFFLGGELGQYALKISGDATLKDTVAVSGAPATAVEIPVAAKVEYTKTYFAFKLGWFGGAGGGLFLGTDLSWQLPLSSDPSVDVNVNTDDAAKRQAFDIAKQQDEYKKMKTNVEDAVDLLGKKFGLSWTILKIGYLF